MIRKLLAAALGVSIVIGLVRSAAAHPAGALWSALVIGAAGYVLWRALPHVRDDLRKLPRLPRGRYSRRRGRALDGGL